MLIITASDVAALFDMTAAFAATREAAIAVSESRTQSPTRAALHTTDPAAEALVMPGVVDGRLIGTKTWYSYRTPLRAMPGTGAFITLLDPEIGEEVLVEGGLITDLRTGAIAGLAAEALATDDATTLTVIGAGIQARTQILAMLHARPSLEEVAVVSRSRDRRDAFVERMTAEIATTGSSARITASDDPVRAVGAADIVVAATTASSPVILDEWITRRDVLVCGVGSHDTESAEIAPDLVARADAIVVDTIAGGLDGAGDVLGPVAAGTVDRRRVRDLGALLSNPPEDRSGLAIFKSVGFSASDIVAASAVARRAIAEGRGTRVDVHS